MRLTPRRLCHLALAAACFALAACATDRSDRGTGDGAGARAPERPSVAASPPPPPYSPPATEVSRDGKRVAGRIAQSLTTYELGASPQRVARRVGAGEGRPRSRRCWSRL